jgi:hypothetical protein
MHTKIGLADSSYLENKYKTRPKIKYIEILILQTTYTERKENFPPI